EAETQRSGVTAVGWPEGRAKRVTESLWKGASRMDAACRRGQERSVCIGDEHIVRMKRRRNGGPLFGRGLPTAAGAAATALKANRPDAALRRADLTSHQPAPSGTGGAHRN